MSEAEGEKACAQLREYDPARGLRDGAMARVATRLRDAPGPARRSRLVLVAALVAAPVASAALYRGTHSPVPAPAAVHAPVAASAARTLRPPAPPVAVDEPAPPVSTVAAEAHALEPAVRALAEHDGHAARCALEAYARAFPEGVLRPEAAELWERVKGLPGSRTPCDEP
jgi:hypothetical protein